MRQIKESEVKQVHRKGRRLVGISTEHFKRLSRLRITSVGKLSLAAVTSTVIDLGLKTFETDVDVA